MQKNYNSLYSPMQFLTSIDLRKKLIKPTITVDLIKEDFTTKPVDFSIIEGCTAHKVGENINSFNQIIEKINN